MKIAIDFLEEIQSEPLSEGLKVHLFETMRTDTIGKRVKLLRVGQVCERIFFVEKGLFRCFVRRGDEEICKWFMREGDVVISVNSFFNQVPSTETIESLERATIHSITYAQLEETYRLFPEFRRKGQKLTERYYCASEVRADDLRMKTAEELYQDWLRQHPRLAGRIRHKHLASYLGMSKQNLSRVKRLLNK